MTARPMINLLPTIKNLTCNPQCYLSEIKKLYQIEIYQYLQQTWMRVWLNLINMISVLDSRKLKYNKFIHLIYKVQWNIYFSLAETSLESKRTVLNLIFSFACPINLNKWWQKFSFIRFCRISHPIKCDMTTSTF